MHCRLSGASLIKAPAARAQALQAAQASKRSTGPVMTLPKLVAFDLDATLWEPEMYLLSSAPHKLGRCPRGRPVVVTRNGREEVGLIGDAWRILHALVTQEQWQGVQIAYVSRTDEPHWANTCLQLLALEEAPGQPKLADIAHHHEIYPGSKTTHFQRIQQRTGIPYSEMLFIDDMQWNIEDVRKLGVCAVYAPQGLTVKAWEQALQQFAKHRGKR